eukprot:8205148-Prorocentrum_lima.AAC.1
MGRSRWPWPDHILGGIPAGLRLRAVVCNPGTQTLLWVGKPRRPQLVLLFWEKHWALLPLRAPNTRDQARRRARAPVIIVAQTLYPGKIEPDGLRGGGPLTQEQETATPQQEIAEGSLTKCDQLHEMGLPPAAEGTAATAYAADQYGS